MDYQLLTNSRRNSYAKCHRRHYYEYELGYRPRKTSDALYFGDLWHGSMEVYWTEKCLSKALEWVDNQIETDYNAYQLETVRQLLIGYYRKWSNQDYDLMSNGDAEAERQYIAPLLNPDTSGVSKTFQLSGKIDVVFRMLRKIMEHKTTSEDISPESDYWLKLSIDGQISGYYVGTKALFGIDCQECVYDVVKKPTMRPYKATPEDKRQYKKDGTLYANQRQFDETVQEWGKRLAIDIEANPDKYYARRAVPRLQEDMVEYFYDMWAVAREIRESQLSNRWPRNPQACSQFGVCPYLGVCTNTASLEDSDLFVKVDNIHQELNLEIVSQVTVAA